MTLEAATNLYPPDREPPKERFRDVVASWSGGIDSTGVVGHLLLAGYRVRLVTLQIYGASFGQREREARKALWPHLLEAAEEGGGEIVSYVERPAEFLWAFSPDGVEIPRRNKHIIDHLITKFCMPFGIKNIAMGEYIGADSWLVKDHVGGADADHRSLSAYIYNEYGLDYRMFSLADFGESRFKSDRMRLLIEALGSAAFLTSNCLYDAPIHCGECYKCLERHAAFSTFEIIDMTRYAKTPWTHPAYEKYLAQMQGYAVDESFSTFGAPKMPSKE